MFSTWRIYTSYKLTTMVFSRLIFLPEEYTPLSVWLKNIYLCASWLKLYFLHLKVFYTQIIYTSVRVDKNSISTLNLFVPEEHTPLCRCFSICSMKNIYLCESWLKWCFLQLKIISTWRICSSVPVLFNFFQWRIFTPVKDE